MLQGSRVAQSVIRNRKTTAGVLALLAAGGSGAVLYLEQAKRAQKAKGKTLSNGSKPRGGKGKGTKALKQMLAFLLPLVGKRIVLVLMLAVARTALSNRLARVQGYMFRSAFLKRVPLFMRNITENVTLCLIAAAIESTSKRILDTVKIDWRKTLTNRIHDLYFSNMTYYKLNYVDRRIDNPEQRICEDIPMLADGLADLMREWCNASIDAVFYAFVLRSYTRTNKYTATIIGYVLGAGVLTTMFSPNFGRLYKLQSSNEDKLDERAHDLKRGSYRQLQTRLRANAEPVASYAGIQKEGNLITEAFNKLCKHRSRLLNTQWLFGMWQDFNTKYLAATMAVVLIIGPFFSGHLQPDSSLLGRAKMLSNMRYHTSVIISLFSSCGVLAASSRKLMKLTAYAERITEMQTVCKDICDGKSDKGKVGITGSATGRIEEGGDEIAFEAAQVVTPSNVSLVQDLNLRIRPGTNLLVMGPNGSGKSSLFRVLGGLWPLTKGVVKKPGGNESGLSHEIFYVPQRPYVTVGTLVDQLIYPLTNTGDGHAMGSEKLRELLTEVDLEYLIEREGGIDSVVDWGSQLSLGEQQRLGMARLFYHTPKFAILDECTSGVTVDMEERFCERVKKMGCTCITISHRPALVAFHDLVLALDGEGGWAIHRGPNASESTDSNQISDGVVASSNRRGTDAAVCLDGMKSTIAAANSDSTPRSSGQILAKSPEYEAGKAVTVRPPKDMLQPVDVSIFQRWSSILKIIVGRGTGARKQMSMILVVVVLRTLLQDRMADLNGRTVKHLLNQDRAAFIRLVGLSMLQSIASAVLAPSLRMVADSLSLEWRKQLTKEAHMKYLHNSNFHAVSLLAGMQDVDVRLTKDMERLSDGISQLIPSMIKPVVDIAWFTAQLGRLTGRRGMIILYLYALGGFAILQLVTPDFGALAKKEYFLEGAFRNLHSRLRTHAESVAFFGGGQREGSFVNQSFKQLMQHLRRVIDIRWVHAVADDFLAKQLPHNVTWALTLLYSLDHPSNFDDNESQGALVNDMRYLASVVTTCFTSFGELLALNKRFAELSGGVVRVSEVLEVINRAEELHKYYKDPLQIAGSESINFDKVDIISPSGQLLARELQLRIQAGKSLLITGPNGSGKSSTVRVLAGLWPLINGSISYPGQMKGGRPGVYYVAQRPYTTIGTLRDQITYPMSSAEASAGSDGFTLYERVQALDKRLDDLMEMVRLKYLVDRQGGWDSTAEWGDTLSLGEQQRIGMARLFFHKPIFGVLDECTNATSVDVEESLYQHAGDLGITLITITQRAALLKYHHAELNLLDGGGSWELKEIRNSP